jgi:hypothetical protein
VTWEVVVEKGLERVEGKQRIILGNQLSMCLNHELVHSRILGESNNVRRGRVPDLGGGGKKGLKSGIHPAYYSWIEVRGKRLSMCLNHEPGFISPKNFTIIHAFLLFVWLLFPFLLATHVGYCL